MAAAEPCAEIKLPMGMADVEDKRVQLIQRAQWLRAAILGASDGLLSTTSLMLGVGAAKEDQRFMIMSGLAGALAGASSMAVGEFASVSTQREIEQKAMVDQSNSKHDFLRKDDAMKLQIAEESIVNGSISDPCTKASPTIQISSNLASEGRTKPMEAEEILPNPYKAALASACAFLCGSFVPLLTAIVFSHHKIRVGAIVVVTSIALAVFGATGARLGGSSARVSAMRVLVGGWFSMAVTYSLLMPFDGDHKGHKDLD